MDKRTQAILEYIWRHPDVDRRRIADIFQLHSNLVTQVTRALLDNGWLVEGPPIRGGVGRGPIPLRLHPERMAAGAVAYTPERLTCALVNAAGHYLDTQDLAQPPTAPERLVAAAADLLQQLRKRFKGEVIGVGIADPGMVDSAKGLVVRSSIFPEWRKTPIAALMRARTGLPTLVEDASRVRALAQYRLVPDVLPARDSMVYLDYGTGLGFALVTPSGVWRGQGLAGELGHLVADPEGPQCRCGAKGCLETRAGAGALKAEATALLDRGIHSLLRAAPTLTADMIFDAAGKGDRLARTVVRNIASHLTPPLAVLAAALHPRFIVIGGETKAAIQCLTEAVETALRQQLLPEVVQTINFLAGQESKTLTVLGAGLLVFESVIAPTGGMAVPLEPDAKRRRRAVWP